MQEYLALWNEAFQFVTFTSCKKLARCPALSMQIYEKLCGIERVKRYNGRRGK